MSKSKMFILLFLAIATNSFGQITITTSAIPVANDTFRFSNAQITANIDPVPTGPNHVWDFSFLTPISQDIDTFRTVTSTGATYALYFADLSFNANRSNQAKKGNLGVPNVPIGGGVTISDVVAFYYKSNTLYQQTGLGATVNGIGIPIGFNNKDVLYRFPMNFGDVDTSASDYNVNIPNLGYYGHDQVRVTEVDGWGTLTTPFGTFNTLRLKSSVTGNDTLFLDTLGFGFQFQSPPRTEYKWLGTTKSIPLLEIVTTGGAFGGAQQVSSVIFRDSLRSFTGINENLNSIGEVNVFPNPVNNWVTITLDSQVDGDATAFIVSPDGRLVNSVWNGDVFAGSNIINFDITPSNLASGCYLLEIRCGNKSARKRLMVVR
ncbi:MAG: T9SS type A sorting domain-containing protein [Bacteroidota bacterium]